MVDRVGVSPESGEAKHDPYLYDMAPVLHAFGLAMQNASSNRMVGEFDELGLEISAGHKGEQFAEAEVREDFTAHIRSRITAKSPFGNLVDDCSVLADSERGDITLFALAQESLIDKILKQVAVIDSNGTPVKSVGILKRIGMHLSKGGVQELQNSRELREIQRQNTVRKALIDLIAMTRSYLSVPAETLGTAIPEEMLLKTARQIGTEQKTAMTSPYNRPMRIPSTIVSSETINPIKTKVKTRGVSEAPTLETTTAQELSEDLDIGVMEFDIPWMGDIKHFGVRKYTDDAEVWVINALEPNKLAPLASRLREGKKVKDGRDPFDRTIHQMAKRLSAGIVPEDQNSGFQSIKIDDTDRRDPFIGLPIYFNPNYGPNAHRVFVGVRQMGLNEHGKPKVLMMVVGIADKQNEISFYTTVSTKSARQLRNEGAGAI